MPGATFLTLPRELRNLIYETLHCSARTPRRRNCFGSRLAPYVEYAPMTNVLLINRRIHHEYWDTIIPALTAIIDLDEDEVFQAAQEQRSGPRDFWAPEEPLCAKIAARLQNLVIIVHQPWVSFASCVEKLWQSVGRVAADSRKKYPQLATIQVILGCTFDHISENQLLKFDYPYCDPTGYQAWWSRINLAKRFQSTRFHYPPDLTGIPIRYHGYGHFIRPVVDDFGDKNLSEHRDLNIVGLDLEIHDMIDITSFVYTLSKSDSLFGIPQLWPYWGDHTYPDDWLQGFDEETVRRILSRERRMLTWTVSQREFNLCAR